MKVTVTLEGSDAELGPVLRFIAAEREAVVKQPETASAESQLEEKQQVETWTEAKIRGVWRGLTYDCEGILKALSKYEDGVPWETFADSFNLKRNQIGGRLSSLGHQIRIHNYGRLPYPIKVYLKENVLTYELDPLWRQVISKIQAEIDAVGTGESATGETGNQ